MNKIKWLGFLVLLATPYIYVPAWGQVVETTVQWVAAQEAGGWQASFPDVTKVERPHDRFTGSGRALGHTKDDPNENECKEPPDGGKDCDDPHSVSEPGSLGLAVLGLAGVGWVWLRRRR